MKRNKKIVFVKDSLEPLYRTGDMFVIVKTTKDKDLMPIWAKHIKTKQVYGFYEDELS